MADPSRRARWPGYINPLLICAAVALFLAIVGQRLAARPEAAAMNAGTTSEPDRIERIEHSSVGIERSSAYRLLDPGLPPELPGTVRRSPSPADVEAAVAAGTSLSALLGDTIAFVSARPPAFLLTHDGRRFESGDRLDGNRRVESIELDHVTIVDGEDRARRLVIETELP